MHKIDLFKVKKTWNFGLPMFRPVAVVLLYSSCCILILTVPFLLVRLRGASVKLPDI
jgi:hypothetical protein